MKRIRNLALFAAVAFAALPSAAQFGDILRRGKQASDKAKKVSDAFTPWTQEQENAIGEASAAKLVHVLGLYDDAGMNKYVNLVGYTVAQGSPRFAALEYKFGILDTESITAFALPGGYVFVTRGALANMKNEAELAGTLAHEIAHVDNRHLEKQIRAKKGTSLALEEVGDHVPGPSQLKNFANNIVTQALTMGYSRDKEDEADRKGTELAAGAGYDPNGLKNFLSTLETAAAADPASKRSLGIWGSTHPPLNERIAALTPIAAKLASGQELARRYQLNASFAPPPAPVAPAGKLLPAAPTGKLLPAKPVKPVEKTQPKKPPQ